MKSVSHRSFTLFSITHTCIHTNTHTHTRMHKCILSKRGRRVLSYVGALFLDNLALLGGRLGRADGADEVAQLAWRHGEQHRKPKPSEREGEERGERGAGG